MAAKFYILLNSLPSWLTSGPPEWASSWVDLLAGAFFRFALGLTAIWGVLQASKTLYQPQETEVFKAQFHQFDEVVSFLNSIKGVGAKSKVEELLQDFREVNYWMLVDYFQVSFLDIALDGERIYEIPEKYKLYNACFDNPVADDGTINLSHFLTLQPKSSDRKDWNKIDNWNEVCLQAISPAQLDEIQARLKDLVTSSYLLPQRIINDLEELRKYIAQRKSDSYQVLNEIVPKLPKIRFPGINWADLIAKSRSQAEMDHWKQEYLKENFKLHCKNREVFEKDSEIRKRIEEIEKYMRKSYKVDKLLRNKN